MTTPKDNKIDSPLRSPHPVAARFSESTTARKSYAQMFGFCEVRNCQDYRLEHELFCAAHTNVDAF